MGCQCSKQLDSKALSNPLQQLRAAESAAVVGGAQQRRRCRRRRQEEKRQRQLAKLQKRNARKRQQRASCGGSSSGNNSVAPQPQLRLRGGSNGSSATECVSALYARSLEQQHEEHQREIELRTRHQLERQLHTFVLNQLLLGIQFFGHLEHELAAIDDQLLARQRACSQTLSEHSLLHASAIDAAVAKRLLFKPNDATAAERLQQPLIYVVFDNVDVARPHDANYDSIASLCKVLLETDGCSATPCGRQQMELLQQSRWMGYVRLKLREPSPTTPTSDAASEAGEAGEADIDIVEEAIYTDGSTSGYSSSAVGCDYDHVYIARWNTQRSLAELQLDNCTELQRNVLPEQCICRLGSCLPAWLHDDDDYDDEDEDEDEEEEEKDDHEEECDSNPSPRLPASSGYETVQVLRQCRVEQRRRRSMLQQCYLGSQRFMHYFGQLLRQQLAEQLEISGPQLAAASYRGCSVYTEQGELVPAIHVPHGWPDCAFEFNLRQRTGTGAGAGAWPTLQMRKRMQSFGYHVVPVGYAPKRARNPFRELEWRIVLPQAELYLERQLTALQLKLLLVLQTLLRSCINDKCQPLGPIMHQLRTHLFWQCERAAAADDWSEQFLGEQLVRFVRSFADCLAKKQLRDFFIERRNLFELVPEHALMELHGIMAAIAEQPLLHVLQALRQLQHAPDFYPPLNCARLQQTLLASDYLQLRSQAKFVRQSLVQPEEQLQREQEQPEETDAGGHQGLLGMRQHQERTRGKLRRKTQLLRAQQLQLQQQQQRRHSEDALPPLPLMPRMSQSSQTSVDSGGSQLNDGLEILRRTNLLELLLDHQLAMLQKASEFRNRHHGELYLGQAQRLCRLYQQLGCSQHAQHHYAESICQAASQLERRLTPSACHSSSPHFVPVQHAAEVHTAEAPTDVVPVATVATVPTVVAVEVPPAAEGDAAAPVATASNKLDALLQRIQLESPPALQAIGCKTEQLVQSLELRDLLKRHTKKLKSAFN